MGSQWPVRLRRLYLDFLVMGGKVGGMVVARVRTGSGVRWDLGVGRADRVFGRRVD
jgi:hypothetical protein